MDLDELRRRLEELEAFETRDDRPTAEWLLAEAGFSTGGQYDEKLPALTKRGRESSLQNLSPIEKGVILALREVEPYGTSYGNFGTMLSDGIFGRNASATWVGEDGRILYAPESEVTLALEELGRKGWIRWE